MKTLTNKKNFKKHTKCLKVYVCGSLRPEVVKDVDKKLKRLLKESAFPIEFLRPTGTDMDKIMDIVREDVAAIEECDELWQIGEYGRDSVWELGFAFGLGKPVKVLIDETNREKMQADVMYRIGFDRDQLKIVGL